MEKFNKHNKRNIRLIFEEKTGVDLNPAHQVRPRSAPKLLYLAAVLTLMVTTMVSCQKRIFSPLSGDEPGAVRPLSGRGNCGSYRDQRIRQNARTAEAGQAHVLDYGRRSFRIGRRSEV